MELPGRFVSGESGALVNAVNGASWVSVHNGGGVGIGNSSPFGQQFGYYANLVRDFIDEIVDVNVGPRLLTAEHGDDPLRQRLHGQHVDRHVETHARRVAAHRGRPNDDRGETAL